MKKLFSILIFLPLFSMAQKQNYVWYFGNGSGLDFNNGCKPEVLTNGGIDGFEGCSAISDAKTGQLLFYTNSDLVYNRNNVAMPDGHLINSGNTITQVLIFKKPGAGSVYYIITSEIQAYSGDHLQYHEIDMTLNGGLGGIVSKNNVIYSSPVTEKITAVKHANGTDIWLIAHEYNSNKFISFLVTTSGISTPPIVSAVGRVHYCVSGYDALGEMKASPDGSKLAAVTYQSPNIDLFKFDNTTGQLSNYISLPENGGYDNAGNISGLYGVSFSSNSKMLYVSKNYLATIQSPGKVIQFNVATYDSATIASSKVNVFTSKDKSLFSLQLAPNRKIYVGQNANEYLGVIDAPDSIGVKCNYVDDGLYLKGKLSGWGLNNLMEYGNYCEAMPEPTGINNSRKENIAINVFPNPFSTETTLQIGEDLKNATLTLYNAVGQKVNEIKNIKGQTVIIKRNNLSAGIYYFHLIQDNQTLAVKKLVITGN